MFTLPPAPPPHVIVRQAEASVVRALQEQARSAAGTAGLQQQYRNHQEHLWRDHSEQRGREMTALLRNRTTTSQRY